MENLDSATRLHAKHIYDDDFITPGTILVMFLFYVVPMPKSSTSCPDSPFSAVESFRVNWSVNTKGHLLSCIQLPQNTQKQQDIANRTRRCRLNYITNAV